ncbi:MAG TPA: hypothetical protein DIW47_02480 [Bacteroidetes bacterium]|nr:hypothetical protein [Bacteroidota bacterium]
MGKFKIKRHLAAGFGIFLISYFMMLSLNACKEAPTPAEKVYLDTLFYKIKGNEKALNIDEQELIRRKDILRNSWIPAVQDTIPDIRRRMEDDFRGMLTAYDYYLDRHLLYKSSTRILLEELEEFKKQTDENQLDRTTFKARYKELDLRIETNTDEIEIIAKPVYELEPMWMRYERMMAMR